MGRHCHHKILPADIQFPLVVHMGCHTSEHAHRLREHAHPGHELVFVLDGEVTYESQGGGPYMVPGGSYSYMPPGLMHRAAGDYETPGVICWIIFNPAAPDAHQNTPFSPADLHAIIQDLSGRDTSVQAFDTSTRHALRRFRMALANYHSPERSASSGALLRSIACQLIVEAVRQINAAQQTPPEVHGEAAVTFIRDHLTDPITVPDIAAHLGFSVSRTYALFREHTGQSPMDYLLRHRIESAEGMLSHTDRSVTEIAFDCGFHSSQYFSRVFKKYRGLTPSAFRAREKQTE